MVYSGNNSIYGFSNSYYYLFSQGVQNSEKWSGYKYWRIRTYVNKIAREDRLSKMTVLTASLSHELNQPLTAILSCAQAGMRFLDSDKLDRDQAKEIFKSIIEDDKRAGGIISGVRSLMKLEIREKENVMVNSLVQETLDIMRNEIFQTWN